MNYDSRSEDVEAFVASLKDLSCNNKTMIQKLTQMSANSIQYAEDIFRAIKIRLQDVSAPKAKLEILYLIDSIIKNVGGSYKILFCNQMVSILPEVYMQVNQGCQNQILKLRQSWNVVFPQASLENLDIFMVIVDASWPIDISGTKPIEPPMSSLPDQATFSADPAVLGFQRKISEIQKELYEIKEKKRKLDYAEAQMMLQATHSQNMNTSVNILETIEKEKYDLIGADSKVIIPIRDPRMLNGQHKNVDSITSEFRCSGDLNCENRELNKNPLDHDCSSIMITRKKTTGGTKRRSPETTDAFVYKKIKEEINDCSSSKAVITELDDLYLCEQLSEENKENCIFNNNMTPVVSYNSSNCFGRYPIACSAPPLYTRPNTRNASPNTTNPQDRGERSPRNGDKEYYSLAATPLRKNRRNGFVQKEDQGINVQKLYEQLVTKGLINNYSSPATTQLLNHPPAAIQAQGNRCHQCDIQFSSEQTVQYRNHLDWHVQQKRTAERNNSPKDEQTRSPFPNFADIESLRIRPSSVIQKLYEGQQCSTCGLRFPSRQSDNYQEHLNWHFRQNRKVNVTNMLQRPWCYSASDWTRYHEAPEENKEKCFELQKVVEGADASSKHGVRFDVENTHCGVCHDKFEVFFDENEEEWRFRMSIRVEDKIYHPACYQDHQNISVAESTLNKSLLDISTNGHANLE